MQELKRRQFCTASVLTGAGAFAGALLRGRPAPAATTDEGIRMPATQVPVAAEADVVVIGGGPAGFGAAMRAARSGVTTLLIERFGGPGGAATSGYMCVTGEGGRQMIAAELDVLDSTEVPGDPRRECTEPLRERAASLQPFVGRRAEERGLRDQSPR